MKLKSYGQFDVFEDTKLDYRCFLFFHDTYLDTLPKKHLNKFYVYARISRWIKSQHHYIQYQQNVDEFYEYLKDVVSSSMNEYKFEMMPDNSSYLVKDPYQFKLMQDGNYEVFFLEKYVKHEAIDGLLGCFNPTVASASEAFREFLSNWIRDVDVDRICREKECDEVRAKIRTVEDAQEEIDILTDERHD